MKTDRHPLHLILIFLFSRIGYTFVGVRFDYEPLWYFRQFIDPVLLREDLFASLLYFPRTAAAVQPVPWLLAASRG